MIHFSSSISISAIDDEVVLLDSESGIYFGLNPVGSRMFQLLKETLSLAPTLERLLGEYEVPREVLDRDLRVFLKTLQEKKLVETDEV